MVEKSNVLTLKLLDLMETTGYPIVQHNGQRKFGPPNDWTGPSPPKGCEVFVGKLPREVFEDELVPIFSTVGTIFEMRLMMDFSGSNRGYAFVTYTNREDANKAVRQLNGYQIRPGRHLGVVKSVDNCRLFVGGIPKTKSREDVLEELSKRVMGIVDVILYKNCFDRRLNRGFAFVEFTSHRAAAMARRALIPGCVKLWDQEVLVDWAEPEPDVDEDQMRKVTVLYARNFLMKTTTETIRTVFETAIDAKVERVKKIYDYAFIHFFNRKDAELALQGLQGADIEGSIIEIRWAKPVDRELYRIQKLSRGNSKFNRNMDFTQTLLLYKQHLEKKEYANSRRDDEGIGSVGAGDSLCGSPDSRSTMRYNSSPSKDTFSPPKKEIFSPPTKDIYTLAPAKLDSMCKRFGWAAPIYSYQRFSDPQGGEVWVGRVELPAVGSPLLAAIQRIGPLATRACFSVQQAKVEAAENALHCIKMLRSDTQYLAACSPLPAPFPATPLPLQYPNYSALYQRSPLPVMPVWRTV